jgi:magnesium-transporting ATPase (P-type)
MRRAEILRTNEALAAEALRTLGVAFRALPAAAFAADNVDERLEQDLVFAGLIGMIDPPRQEAKEAVARAKSAGIRPMMGVLLVDVIGLADQAGGGVVLPLLATQILWINLVIDGAAAPAS